MAFHQHPAIAAPLPVMVNPDGAWMRGMGPKAMNPDVVLAIPAVVAFDPHPSDMRRIVMMLNDGWRRRNADDDLSHRNRGSETYSEQPCQKCLLHRNLKPPWFRSAGMGGLSLATNSINPVARRSLRIVEKSASRTIPFN